MRWWGWVTGMGKETVTATKSEKATRRKLATRMGMVYLPGDLCGDVERTLVEVERGGLGKTMQGLVSQAEMRVLKRRLRAVLDPRWRFPEPSSAWSIPWPPV